VALPRNRRRPADLALLAGVTGLWSVCFVLHLGQVVEGRLAWIPLYVSASDSAGGFPTVRALWPGAGGELAPGDVLAAVGDQSLAGASPFAFVRAVYAHSELAGVAVTRVRGSESSRVSLALQPLDSPWRRSLTSAAFALLGALAFWRARGSRAGRRMYLAMTAYAFHWADFWSASPPLGLVGLGTFAASSTLFMPLALRTVLVWPEDSVSAARRTARWPWLFALNGPIVTSWAFGVPAGGSVSRLLALALQIVFIATFVAQLTRSYRAAAAVGRRQLKWVVVGLWLGLVPSLTAGAIALLQPAQVWLYEASLVFTLALPVCFFIALARYNLLDVDRLLTQAVISPLIGIALISLGLVAVPAAAQAAEAWVDPKVSQPALSLALGGVAFFGLRRVDRAIQSFLYPERGVLMQEALRLRRELGECANAADVLTLLARRVFEILKLATTALYARDGGGFALVFARGPAVSPSFAVEGPFARALAAREAPLEPQATQHEEDPAETAALAAMGVELAVPVVLRGELAAFLCLGGKRSGDIFTPTDRALLQGLADKAADELLHFSREDLARETRQVMDRLRAYVPGAVAREITSGAKLEAGEREVTVLFVDIRGYTSFSEGQRPETIFSAVSAYTQVVSRIVTDCGGSVVEFNGDGLMTVFGAPRALADKERAAVRAARAIAHEVPTLALRDASGRPHHFHVGIGIATGPGYVGNVRAVDRSIWVALGNTTNLAARLERMTRELGAAVVIDVETHKAAGDLAAEFRLHAAQRVRGRSELVDVFSWSPAGFSAPPISLEEETT
jgi:class 3 adenylate cyclase